MASLRFSFIVAVSRPFSTPNGSLVRYIAFGFSRLLSLNLAPMAAISAITSALKSGSV